MIFVSLISRWWDSSILHLKNVKVKAIFTYTSNNPEKYRKFLVYARILIISHLETDQTD